MKRRIDKLAAIVGKLEDAVNCRELVYTLSDGSTYNMVPQEEQAACAALLFDNEVSEQGEILLEAVECSDNSQIHLLLQMVIQ